MKVQVIVRLKDGVLDPQGEAVAKALNNLGFDTVEAVRQGKMIELVLHETDLALAKCKVTDMCEKLLANSVIESYEIEIVQ